MPNSLYGILDKKAEDYPEHCPFVVDGTISLSYKQWSDESQQLASQLLAHGIKPGAVVALWFDGLDWVQYACCYIAVLRAGCTVMHLNSHVPLAEITQRLATCKAKILICGDRSAEKSHDLSIKVVRYQELKSTHLGRDLGLKSLAGIRPAQIAEIRYTSGTTGQAKGYTVPHDNLIFAQTLDTMQQLANSRGMLVPIGIGNSSSATVLTIAVTSSNRMILCDSNDIPRMGELIEQFAVHSLMLTPFVAAQILDYRLDKSFDLSSVKLLALASSPVPKAHADKLLKMFNGATLQIACAQSEASPALLTAEYDPNQPFVVGKPTPLTQIRVMKNEQSVRQGELGELWLKTSAPKRLYIGPANTRNSNLESDGWYRTGDIVRWQSDETIEFFDRQADVIEIGGTLYSSVHLEEKIYENEMVNEVAIVSPKYCSQDNYIRLFIVLYRPDLHEIGTDQVVHTMKGLGIKFKVSVINSLPRTSNGKVKKDLLRLR